jgi:hypothetical protein
MEQRAAMAALRCGACMKPVEPTAESTVRPMFPWAPRADFLTLFRTFRIAIQPTQMVVALLALVLIYASGRAFDGVWGLKVFPGEIQAYRDLKPSEYARLRNSKTLDQTDQLKYQLMRLAPDQDVDVVSKSPDAAFNAIKAAAIKRFHDRVDEINKTPRTDGFNSPDEPTAGEQARLDRATAAKALQSDIMEAKAVAGQGIFDSLMAFELDESDALVDNTLMAVRLMPVRSGRNADVGGGDPPGVGLGLFSRSSDRIFGSDTVLGCVASMAVLAPEWLICGTEPMQWEPNALDAGTWKGTAKVWLLHRGPYLLSLLVLLLFWFLIAVVTGGFIARSAAGSLVGKPQSLVTAGRAVLARLTTLIAAPLAPLVILAVLGLVLTLIGLIGAIPFVGEILIGIGFILILVVAFVMMLLTLGILGGYQLLIPAVMVEGTDSFDAMSRAFAYVYNRPWKLLWYSCVALVYGVLTYLFVALAIFIVLGITHLCVGAGTGLFGHESGWYNGAPKLETLWSVPRAFELAPQNNWAAMNGSEHIGAGLISFWVYLVISVQGAFAISFYFSAQVIIYLLLRKNVDGQGIADVETLAEG